jgi:hypothetical protein
VPPLGCHQRSNNKRIDFTLEFDFMQPLIIAALLVFSFRSDDVLSKI